MKTKVKNDKKEATKRVFFAACTAKGYPMRGLAFGGKKENPLAIAMKGYRKQTDTPISVLFVFPSADSYYLEEMPIAYRLSEEIRIKKEKVRCYCHKESRGKNPVSVKNGLPECFHCREDIIIAAIKG